MSTAYNFMPLSSLSWILTVSTGALGAVWAVYDMRNLIKHLGADLANPLERDKRFGYIMGIIIGLVGVFGVLKYHFL